LVVQGRGSEQTPHAAASKAGPIRQTSLNGTIQFTTLGLTLQVPRSMFGVQRFLAWSYSGTLGGFTAPISLSGSVTAVKMDAGDGRVDLVAGDVNCTVSGEVALFSAAYPGPGFNGTYGLSRGSWLSLTPDPWTWFNIIAPAPASRHMLGEGTTVQQQQQQRQQQQQGLKDAGDARQQLCDDASRHGAGEGKQSRAGGSNCTGYHESIQACSSSGSSSSGEEQATCHPSLTARQLLQSTGSTTSRQPVQGRLTVAEPGTYYPNPTADAARGDKNAWLDDSGSISIQGADQVPAELLPQWKKGGWGVRWVIPVWLWIAGAGGVVLLCVVGVGIWAIVAARRRRREDRQERVEGVETLGLEPVLPGQADKAWAERVTTPSPQGRAQGQSQSHRRPPHISSPRAHHSPRPYPSSPRGPSARQSMSFGNSPSPRHQHHHHHPSHLRSSAAGSPRQGARAAPWEQAPADTWVNDPHEPPWESSRY
jgi:hypothetical protein